jgi:hypothetical protein
LAAIHFRILVAIASFDRMSKRRKKGSGCFARDETLEMMGRVNAANFSTAANELARWGYLEIEKDPENRRRRIYRIVYDHLPTGKASGPESRAESEADRLPTGNVSSSTNERDGTDPLPKHAGSGPIVCPIVCPPKQQDVEGKQQSGLEESLRELKEYSEERESLRDHVDLKVDSRKIAAFLVESEKSLNQGTRLNTETWQRIEMIVGCDSLPDRLSQWARRLIEEPTPGNPALDDGS